MAVKFLGGTMLWDIIYANIGIIWLGWETYFNHSILNLCNL